MAIIEEIHALRIEIYDPPEIIQILSVATAANLPTIPTPQTAYYIIDTGIYVTTEKTINAIPADYVTEELYLSDTSLSLLIDTYGTTIAIWKAIIKISSKLASKLLIVKTNSGAESTEYIKLNDLYKYYMTLVNDLKDEGNSGCYGSMKPPEIAGGNI